MPGTPLYRYSSKKVSDGGEKGTRKVWRSLASDTDNRWSGVDRETVNRASRMESHGVPGEIQVSDATKRLLDEDFVFEDRGMLEIKGIGETRAWILKRRK